jgi:hypothetical protein
MERPPSFAEDRLGDWGLWVLEHGLPDLPEAVRVGESVPVARWVGPSRAAVVHVGWSRTADDDDDELGDDVEMFYRDGPGWASFSGMGGGGWFDPPLVRPRMGARQAHIAERSGASEVTGMSCETCVGFAGLEATTIELADREGITRMLLESPLGVFVVATEGGVPAVVRVLDADDVVLAEETFGGELPTRR